MKDQFTADHYAAFVMSETMQAVGGMAKHWQINVHNEEELRSATITALMEVVRIIDAGGISCSAPQHFGILTGLLACVFETVLDGKFADSIKEVKRSDLS
jgi:hypothetical protein